MTFLGFGPFGFGIRRPYELVLKKGESAIISEWNWRKFGFTRKLVQIDSEGNVNVRRL